MVPLGIETNAGLTEIALVSQIYGNVNTIKLFLQVANLLSHRGRCQGKGSEEIGAEERGMKHTKILVVEDNEDNRRVLVLRLQQLGEFDIREAATGQAALDWITREPPDVLFLDLKLPGSAPYPPH
jgi:PleD family two-component response regulator